MKLKVNKWKTNISALPVANSVSPAKRIVPFRWPETSTLSPTTKSQDSSEFWRFLIVDKPKVGEKSEKKEKIKLIYALKYIKLGLNFY